jgi:hypothetical protein
VVVPLPMAGEVARAWGGRRFKWNPVKVSLLVYFVKCWVAKEIKNNNWIHTMIARLTMHVQLCQYMEVWDTTLG